MHAEIEKETPKQSFGISLPFELGGKRARRIAVAEATLEVGEAELAQTIIDIRSQVRRAYFARLISDLRLAVLGELRQFATRARDAAQARFDVGSAPRLELLPEHEAACALGVGLGDLDLDVLLAGARAQHHFGLARLARRGRVAAGARRYRYGEQHHFHVDGIQRKWPDLSISSVPDPAIRG